MGIWHVGDHPTGGFPTAGTFFAPEPTEGSETESDQAFVATEAEKEPD